MGQILNFVSVACGFAPWFDWLDWFDLPDGFGFFDWLV
ncbi:hypothetical protein PPN31114_01353 [Pandoraea pneumonica]|jgi:hypothetical protein|uniref:Uncharacterized protein n=1 Tax=Pandoraea pneumonica TaxID=2508299 RepID=A0A5E4TDU6_9BURK|nr:hypothetical protein PPN31114_01353 [Pandoraea pneumonica]